MFNDIVFDDSEFIPIGTADKPFRGKLDGNNKIISGINATTYYPVGGIVGDADRHCIIDRIVNRGNVSSSKEDNDAFVGGIAGSTSCNITNSCNYGTVNKISQC